jgi:hypothetical protein
MAFDFDHPILSEPVRQQRRALSSGRILLAVFSLIEYVHIGDSIVQGRRHSKAICR